MAAVTIRSDFGAQENKICHWFHFSPSICHEVMGTVCHHLNFLMLSSKPAWITFQEAQPCCDEEAYTTQWIYEPCHAGPPKTDRSQWRVLAKHGPLEEEMTTNSSISTWRTPWPVWKEKRYDTRKIWHPHPRSEGVQYAPGEEKRAVTNSSRKNELAGPKRKWQMWMYLI